MSDERIDKIRGQAYALALAEEVIKQWGGKIYLDGDIPVARGFIECSSGSINFQVNGGNDFATVTVRHIALGRANKLLEFLTTL